MDCCAKLSRNSKFKIQNPKSLHLPPPLSWSNSKPPLSASNSSVMNAQTHSEIGPSLRILTLRSQRVLLDTDLARLYGVETRALNQAVKRNLDRFPSEFAFPLTREEILSISQTVTSLGHLKFSKKRPSLHRVWRTTGVQCSEQSAGGADEPLCHPRFREDA